METSELIVHCVNGLLTIWALVWTWIYWQNRHDDFIARRLPSATLLFSFMMMIQFHFASCTLNINSLFTNTPWLCYLAFAVRTVGMPVICSTYPLRSCLILFSSVLNQARLGTWSAQGSAWEQWFFRLHIQLAYKLFHTVKQIRWKLRKWWGKEDKELELWMEKCAQKNQVKLMSGPISSVKQRTLSGSLQQQQTHSGSGTIQIPTSGIVIGHANTSNPVLTITSTPTQTPNQIVDLETIIQLGTVKSEDLICFYALVALIGTLNGLLTIGLFFLFFKENQLILSGAQLPPWFNQGPYYCQTYIFLPNFLYIMILCSPTISTAFLVRNIPDPLMLVKESFISIALFIGLCNMYVIDFVASKWWSSTGYGPDIWFWIVIIIEFQAAVVMPVIWLWQIRAKRRSSLSTNSASIVRSPSTTRQIANSSQQAFEAMFNHPVQYEKFKKIVAESLSYENIMFYESYQSFVKLSDPNKIRVQANDIYNDFIKSESPNELNLKSETRTAVRDAILADHYTLQIFDTVYAEVMKMLCTPLNFCPNSFSCSR